MNHPAPDLITSWIRAGKLYMVLNHDSVDAYREAKWAIDVPPEQALIVHALGVLPERAGQGIARFILDSTIELARAHGMQTVRLDVYEDNTPALSLYSDYGFTDLGCHTVDYGSYDLTQFHLFEYVL